MYEVEKIINKRINPETNTVQYEVKYVGYSQCYNKWCPRSQLSFLEELIDLYECEKSRDQNGKIPKRQSDQQRPKYSEEKNKDLAQIPKIRKNIYSCRPRLSSQSDDNQNDSLIYDSSIYLKQVQKIMTKQQQIGTHKSVKNSQKRGEANAMTYGNRFQMPRHDLQPAFSGQPQYLQKLTFKNHYNYSSEIFQNNEFIAEKQRKPQDNQEVLKILQMHPNGLTFKVETKAGQTHMHRQYLLRNYSVELCIFYEENYVRKARK